MGSGDVYQAFFCPHCGVHLNEGELDTDETGAPQRRALGGLVNCGWCGEQHSFDQVVRCRAIYKVRDELARQTTEAQLVEDLLELEESLR